MEFDFLQNEFYGPKLYQSKSLEQFIFDSKNKYY